MRRWPGPVLLAVVVSTAAACGSADLDRSSDESSEPTNQPTPSEAPAPDPTGPDEPSQPRIDLSATVALDNCSGSLVRFTTSEATDPAQVLTNGHCHEAGFLDRGEVLVDEPSSRSMVLLDAGGDPVADLRASSIVYGTMTVTDVLLYELDQTYDQIEQATGVTALTLATQQAPVGTEISVASGYWQRIYTCSIDSYVYRMHEAAWTWNQSLQYRQPGCEIVGGTSGSPVISHDTGEVVGVNNTSNERGKRCTLNNPCEEGPGGSISVERGESYAQQSVWFYTCLTGTRELDLTLDGCQLPS